MRTRMNVISFHYINWRTTPETTTTPSKPKNYNYYKTAASSMKTLLYTTTAIATPIASSATNMTRNTAAKLIPRCAPIKSWLDTKKNSSGNAWRIACQIIRRRICWANMWRPLIRETWARVVRASRRGINRRRKRILNIIIKMHSRSSLFSTRGKSYSD